MLSLLKRFSFLILCGIYSHHLFAHDLVGKKVFILHSYNDQFPWTKTIHQTVENFLKPEGIQTYVFYMDTKNYPSEAEKLHKAHLAKMHIDAYKPDLVITSDDDAVKYVLMPFYRNSTLPFVFCGVNWDETAYQLPYSNTTGILEIELLHEIVRNLQEYSKGSRIGTLALDGFTERKWVDHYRKHLGSNLEKTYFPTTFSEWKEHFLKLQTEVDMILLLNPKGLKDWDMQEAENFVLNNIKIPTGSAIEWMSRMSLLGITLVAEEQGQWAAQSAIQILHGMPPTGIPIARNRDGKLFINFNIAKKLDITFKSALLKLAKFVR